MEYERKTVSVKDLEFLLVCLPGVQKARVVVNDWGAIEEIHILTGLGRNPKQIVRDIQSALKAQWDITVDRRKISVALVRTNLPMAQERIRYIGHEIRADATTGRAEVSVTLDRTAQGVTATYTGKTDAGLGETATLLGLAKATCVAVNSMVKSRDSFHVADASVFSIGSLSAVAVLLDLITPRRNQERLLGSALVRREATEACVRATLDAANRRLETLERMPLTQAPQDDGAEVKEEE